MRVLRGVLVGTAAGLVALGALAGCGGTDAEPASAYCRRVAEINALDLLADPAPPAVQRDLEQLLQLTRRAAAVAPPAIRADMQAALDAQVRFNALYESHDWDPVTTQRDPEFIAFAGDADLAAVYTRLERYEVGSCRGDPAARPVAPA